jgi:actin-related protein 3
MNDTIVKFITLNFLPSFQRAVVIDVGTGFTKMGYAGELSPDIMIPTAIAAADEGASDISGSAKDGIRDLDFCIGDGAVVGSKHATNYPVRHGLIENWTNIERIWQRCFFEYLRCDPEEHYVVLTEPPLNPPENREYSAEIMFETFNVPGLYIGVQAVLALAAGMSQSSAGDNTLTGTVVDSGDGVTHVIPISDGYVIGGAIKHIPLAGRDITAFVQRSLRERGEVLPPEDSLDVARRIKESACYVGQDIVKEFQRFDRNPDKHFSSFDYVSPRGSRAAYRVDVGYEQFLAPELFFNPEIYSSDFTKPLPEVVDEAILGSPIDSRRGLYGRIVLSGGSTVRIFPELFVKKTAAFSTPPFLPPLFLSTDVPKLWQAIATRPEGSR